jgi:hypothetical protein
VAAVKQVPWNEILHVIEAKSAALQKAGQVHDRAVPGSVT